MGRGVRFFFQIPSNCDVHSRLGGRAFLVGQGSPPPHTVKKWLVRLIVLAALVGGGLALRWTVLAPEPTRVTVTPAERGRVEATVANSKAGTVRARRRAKLSPGTSGIVTELAVERGQRAAAGDLLLRLDDETQKAQLALSDRALDVSIATHASSCIAAERALRELERNRKLATEGRVSVDYLDELENAHELAVAQCKVAAAEVEHSRAAVAVAQAQLNKTELRAPFDAVIAEVSVELGEWVTPSVPLMAAPDLIDAIDPSSLYISAPIDEVEAARLAPGKVVRVTIDSHPGQTFAGHIVKIAPYVLDVEQQNRTVEVEVELEDDALAASLLPGTSADVDIVLDTKEDALRVPAFALLDGERVFVVEDGQLVERQVQVGLKSWEWIEVRGGLAVGEAVVVSFDANDLEAGEQVVVEGEEGAQ